MLLKEANWFSCLKGLNAKETICILRAALNADGMTKCRREPLWIAICFLPTTRNANDRVPQSKVPLLHFVTVAECKYVTEGSQFVFLSERTERKRSHLHFASGSECRWNAFCQQLEMQMTVSHNPKFPAAFCDSSRMQICYWRKPIGFPVWKDWTHKKPFAFCERL